MKKTIYIIISLLLLCGLIFSCISGKGTKKIMHIGAIFYAPTTEQDKEVLDFFQKKSEDPANHLEVINTRIDLTAFENTLSTFSEGEKKKDGIILYVRDEEVITDLINKSNSKNSIYPPIVFFIYGPSRTILHDTRRSMIVVGPSDTEIGIAQAKQLIHTLSVDEMNEEDTINIGILTGNIDGTSQIERTNSFSDYIAENSNLKITRSQSANWKKYEAMNIAQNWIKNRDITAIIANNDDMALGAIIPIREKGISDIIVIGAGGTKDSLHAIHGGHLVASIDFHIEKIYSTSLEALHSLSDGNMPSQEKGHIYTPITVITKDNI